MTPDRASGCATFVADARFNRHTPRPSVAPMLARVTTFTIDGLEPRRVTVEIDVRAGPAELHHRRPGRPRGARGARARARRRSSTRASSSRSSASPSTSRRRRCARPARASTSPSRARSSPPAGTCPADALERYAVFGELGARGRDPALPRRARGGRGNARAAGLAGLVVPLQRALEAAPGRGARRRRRRAAWRRWPTILRGGERPPPPDGGEAVLAAPARHLDLADVRGHTDVVEALTIAAAGAHNLLLSGPPGVGKTMLARRLPSILPPLSRAEAIEVTRIHSVAGQHRGARAGRRAPVPRPASHDLGRRAWSAAAGCPVPGEASLAHHGVLFLDELSEFPRPALEALRQPLEDGRVAIVRGQRTAIFPTRFLLVAATNPCPCGYAPSRRCRCREADLARHARRLSGPLLDRIDLLVHVQRPDAERLAQDADGVLGDRARARDGGARAPARAPRRDRGDVQRPHGRAAAAPPRPRARRRRAPARWTPTAAGDLSARGRDRTLRLARTIADLAASDEVAREHVVAALGYRHEMSAGVGVAA